MSANFTLAKPYFKPPFKHDFGMIVDKDHHRMLDVRGWGYLTGGGALNLPQEKAADIQDQIGESVAKLLSENWEKKDQEGSAKASKLRQRLEERLKHNETYLAQSMEARKVSTSLTYGRPSPDMWLHGEKAAIEAENEFLRELLKP